MTDLKGLTFAITVAGLWLAFSVVGMPGTAGAASSLALSNRVEAALRANDNLNGANCYTPAPGVIVLYGKVSITRTATWPNQSPSTFAESNKS